MDMLLRFFLGKARGVFWGPYDSPCGQGGSLVLRVEVGIAKT